MKPQWESLTDQQNTQNNVSTLQQLLAAEGQTSDIQVVFSHVPKTAGTSLENILAKNFRFADVLHINAPDLNQCPQLLELKKNPFKLICGHHPIHGQLYGLLPNIKTFHLTMLRNPVDRVLSYYNYIQGKADHPMHGHAAGISLEQFIENNPSPELHNGQVRRFSGYLHQDPIDETAMLKKALDTLNTAFTLVLTTCLFDESLLLLQQPVHAHHATHGIINQQHVIDVIVKAVPLQPFHMVDHLAARAQLAHENIIAQRLRGAQVLGRLGQSHGKARLGRCHGCERSLTAWVAGKYRRRAPYGNRR